MTPVRGSYRDFVLEQLRAAGGDGILRDDLVNAGVPNIGLGAHIESLRHDGHRIGESLRRIPGGRVDTLFRLEILPAGQPETKSASPDAAKQVERPTPSSEPLPEKEPIG